MSTSRSEEMAGKVKPLRRSRPRMPAALANERRQGQQLAGIGLGLGRADRAARFRTDGDEIVVAAGDRAAIEIEPETELREEQQLVAHQGRAPAARRRRRLDRIEQALRALRKDADRADLRASAVAVSTVAHSIAAAGSGSDSSGPRLWTSSTVACGSCASVRGRKLRLDDIAGDQHGPHPPSACAANISGHEPLFRRHQPNDRAMLAVVRGARRRWPGVSILIRADGNNRRAGAPSRC